MDISQKQRFSRLGFGFRKIRSRTIRKDLAQRYFQFFSQKDKHNIILNKGCISQDMILKNNQQKFAQEEKRRRLGFEFLQQPTNRKTRK